MRIYLCLFSLTFAVIGLSFQADDPTLYEYYTSGGLKSGLEANSDEFTLNGKHFVIYSGSMHYFRVPPNNWPTILANMKDAGLNTVQLYLPWNLHEETPGHFDFQSGFLDLEGFLEEIKYQGMFAIVRPGPYICAEMDLGGFPSWLLRDPNMKLRSNYKPFLDRVKLYWTEALKIINKNRFSKNGGSVIALQLENEYSNNIRNSDSKEYLNFLRDIVIKSGFDGLLFQSDPGSLGQRYPIKGIFPNDSVLQTINMDQNYLQQLTELKKHQLNKPAFVSEFYSGWFDTWHTRTHHTYSVERFEKEVSDILFKANGSINFYMFNGGTNFGFINGARVTTSYDFDAPLSEAGNFTAKWHKTKELYAKLVATGRLPKIKFSGWSFQKNAVSYEQAAIKEFLPFETILKHTRQFTNVQKLVPMELLNYTEEATYGQRFGFILYRIETEKEVKTYEVTGRIRDRAIFLVNQNQTGMIEDGANSFSHTFTHEANELKSTSYKYDILVENMGRPDIGEAMNHARKGILNGDIKLDGNVANNITIYSLDFNATFLYTLGDMREEWQKYEHNLITNEPTVPQTGPALYRTVIRSNRYVPEDTYLLLPGWTKGCVFVNGFNVGRYWSTGPQKTLYIPGVFMHAGSNHIDVFELHQPGQALQFVDHPVY